MVGIDYEIWSTVVVLATLLSALVALSFLLHKTLILQISKCISDKQQQQQVPQPQHGKKCHLGRPSTGRYPLTTIHEESVFDDDDLLMMSNGVEVFATEEEVQNDGTSSENDVSTELGPLMIASTLPVPSNASANTRTATPTKLACETIEGTNTIEKRQLMHKHEETESFVTYQQTFETTPSIEICSLVDGDQKSNTTITSNPCKAGTENQLTSSSDQTTLFIASSTTRLTAPITAPTKLIPDEKAHERSSGSNQTVYKRRRRRKKKSKQHQHISSQSSGKQQPKHHHNHNGGGVSAATSTTKPRSLYDRMSQQPPPLALSSPPTRSMSSSATPHMSRHDGSKANAKRSKTNRHHSTKDIWCCHQRCANVAKSGTKTTKVVAATTNLGVPSPSLDNEDYFPTSSSSSFFSAPPSTMMMVQFPKITDNVAQQNHITDFSCGYNTAGTVHDNDGSSLLLSSQQSLLADCIDKISAKKTPLSSLSLHRPNDYKLGSEKEIDSTDANKSSPWSENEISSENAKDRLYNKLHGDSCGACSITIEAELEDLSGQMAEKILDF